MDVTSLTDADRAALIEQCYSSVEEVCSQLDEAEWDLPTDLEGWSVKDNLSHLLSYESIFLGRPRAPEDVDISAATWVENDFQAFNEREVEWRRPTPGPELLEEFREVTTERAKKLRSMDDAAWSSDTNTPFGPMQARDAIGIRTMDFFFHDQDIRRAVSRPGGLDGDVARFAFTRLKSLGAPRIVAKQAAAPDGTVVAFDVDGGWAFGVRVADGRGEAVDAPVDAAARLSLDLEAFLCLFGGRWTPQDAREAGRVRVSGDEALAAKILEHIAVIP